MSPRSPHVLLVPGAWMGGWIWEPTVARLRKHGVDAATLTLAGLEAGTPAERRGTVRLQDHVDQVLTHLTETGADSVVLVGHSYSGMVVAQVADQLREKVACSIHFGSFLPSDGHSLIDGFGATEGERAAERAGIVAAGYQWAPPPAAALDFETGLASEERRYLLERFVPHPGRTVLDPAVLKQPVVVQNGVYVTARKEDVPAALQEADAPNWRTVPLASGHWPMLERPLDVVDLRDCADRKIQGATVG